MKHTKRILSILLTVLLLALSFPTTFAAEKTVLAQGYCGAADDGKNLTWTLTDDKVLTISGTGAMADASGITGRSVIGDVYSELFYADFLEILHEHGYNYSSYTELAEALNSGEAPEEVEEIGRQWAQENDYTALSAAAKEKMPKTLIVEEGVTTIGNYMITPFNGEGILSLQSIFLPSTLTSIGDHAFYLQNAVGVQIPENVRSIGQYAFFGMPFRTLTLPAGCESVGAYAFTLSNNTTDLYVYNDNIILDENAISIPIYQSTQVIPEKAIKEYIRLLWSLYVVQYATYAVAAEMILPLSEFLYQVFGSQLVAKTGFDFFSLDSDVPEMVDATLIAYALGEINEILHTNFTTYDEIEIHPDDYDGTIYTDSFLAAIGAWAENNNFPYNTGNESDDYEFDVLPLGQPLDEYMHLYSDLTVHANPGSVAQQAANTTGVKFVCLNHAYTFEVTKTASCTETGIRTYTCPDCGATKTEVIDKTAHTPGAAVKENEVAATTEHGGSYDEVVYCSVCGNELSRTAKTTDPLTQQPTDPAGNEPAPKLNFFQRIIQWFRNLFARLFGRA